MRFGLIEDQRDVWPVRIMCDALSVSPSGYQALKSLAPHKTDRNDARGLAHLARTGFFKTVYVKSLPAHAVWSLIIEAPPNWWTPLLSSEKSGKVSNGPGAASIHR